MRKKIMAILVAASLCMSMTTAAFAADNTADADPAAGSEDVVQEDAAESAEDYGIVTYADDSKQNTFDTAETLTMGTTYSSSISSSDPDDYWKFTIPSSGRVQIFLDVEAGINFVVYDSNRNDVCSNFAGLVTADNPREDTLTLDLVEGTYYVGAHHYWQGKYGNYKIRYASFTSAGESFKETISKNNNTVGSADSISLNTTYKGQIAENDTVDYYKFMLKNDQDVLVSIDNADLRTECYIYESNNTNSYVWHHGMGKEDSVRTTVSLSAGTYYFKVTQHSYTGNYSFSLGDNKNGVCKADDGNWYNYKDGAVQKGVTVAKNSSGWWYIDKNGKVDFNYTGFASNSNGKWYCEKGKVTFKKNGVIKDTTGAIGSKGTWYYVTGSQMQSGYTGVANYKNSNGWWYIKKGKVDFSANTVAKNKNGWWYVTGGKVQFGYTGVANYKNSNGWWYIKNGKVDFSYTGRARNKNGTWNVVNGKVRF